MTRLTTASPIIALTYANGAEAGLILRQIADHLSAAGVMCCGFVQRDEERADRPRCDMYLVDVESGERMKISEDRGAHAQGCRLDEQGLLAALTKGRARLAMAGVLLLNKFGKAEAEGRGFRPLIADAMERSIPLVIGVPQQNVAGWKQFAGALSVEHDIDGLSGLEPAAIADKIGLRIAAGG